MPVMRFLLLGDTHLGYDFPVRPKVERRRRGEEFFAAFQQVLDHAISMDVDFVIHAGDLFFRSKVPAVIVDRVYERLHWFTQSEIPLYLVPGNHERSRLPTSIFLDHPAIHVFDQSRTFHLKVRGVSVSISGFPYESDVRTAFPKIVKQTGWQSRMASVRLLCMHQAVEGCRVAGYTFRSGGDVIRASDLPEGFTAMVSGHIHRQQVLTFGRNKPFPFIYPSSTARTSFQEKDEIKGFMVVTLKEQGGEWSVKELDFHHLPSRPMIDLNLNETISPGKLCKSITALPPDAIVRVRIGPDFPREQLALLSSGSLRKLAPATMNIEVPGGIFRKR